MWACCPNDRPGTEFWYRILQKSPPGQRRALPGREKDAAFGPRQASAPFRFGGGCGRRAGGWGTGGLDYLAGAASLAAATSLDAAVFLECLVFFTSLVALECSCDAAGAAAVAEEAGVAATAGVAGVAGVALLPFSAGAAGVAGTAGVAGVAGVAAMAAGAGAAAGLAAWPLAAGAWAKAAVANRPAIRMAMVFFMVKLLGENGVNRSGCRALLPCHCAENGGQCAIVDGYYTWLHLPKLLTECGK